CLNSFLIKKSPHLLRLHHKSGNNMNPVNSPKTNFILTNQAIPDFRKKVTQEINPNSKLNWFTIINIPDGLFKPTRFIFGGYFNTILPDFYNCFRNYIFYFSF